MSLGTPGTCTIPNHRATFQQSLKLGPEAGRATNRTNDIDGAEPSKYATLTNRAHFHDPADVRGAKPLVLHRSVNAPDNKLRVDDIDGAQPKPYTFKTTRNVDPLVPTYQLPSVQHADAVIPKFTRDSFDVSDIAGTRPKPKFRFQQRPEKEPVKGATPGWRPAHQRARRDGPPLNMMFDVSDITDTRFKSQRENCPLRPSYKINGMTVTDDLKYTTPKALPAPANHDYYSLQTHDIEGAQCGWRPPHECQPPMEDRRHFRNTNFIGDIAGAQPDTVKHAMRTERVVNPLNPVYKSLDGDHLGPPMTSMYEDPPVPEFVPPKPKNIVPVAKSHSSAIPMGDAEKDRLISQLEGELKTLRSVQPSSSAPTPARAPTAANPPMTKTQLVSTNKGGMTSRMQTPAEKREAKSLADDIASVRGL